MSLPLFIRCKRPGCESIREVRSRTEQATQKFCSPHCQALMRRWQRKGARHSATTRRRQMLARIGEAGATPEEGVRLVAAFRLGYARGYVQASQRRVRLRRAER